MKKQIQFSEEEKEAIRVICQNELIVFSGFVGVRYQPQWLHREIAQQLERVESGEVKRLMLFVPPRHGKSQLASIDFPAWYLGRHPEKEIITSSYSAELAQDFGYKTRNLVNSQEYQELFQTKLRDDSKSKAKWLTQEGGGYTAVGVGGAITGRGADILLIDDPVKNREEAESKVVREKIWNWYTSTAYTRLEKDAAVVLIMCMVGETPVLMADGSEKYLKDIQVGDVIATYENGKLTTSTVKNWANQGKDQVFEINTISGVSVKANERHPFLVRRNNKIEWIKLKNLKKGDKIIKASPGERGKELSVQLKGAQSQQNVEDSVCHTTTKQCEPMDTNHHLATQTDIELEESKIGMELPLRNTKSSPLNNKDDVQYADSCQEKTLELIGEENSASTTTTQLEKCEDCSATTVILQSDTEKQKKFCSKRLNTYEITLDEIIEIKPVGYEDVFDIQVDRTENFIANGLVSHNTRWHMDDLAGRLLEAEKNGGDKWEVVKFPAIALKDENYRQFGEPLWPEKYDLKALQSIRTTVGSYDWSALYQQEPVLSETQEFKPQFIQHRTLEEVRGKDTVNYLTIDTAISQKASADNNGYCLNFIDRENKWNIKAWKAKESPTELIENLFTLQQEFKLASIGIEETIYLQVVKPFLDAEMRKRNRFLRIIPLKHNQTQKETRIRALIPRYESYSVYHIKGHCTDLEEEQAQFPVGIHDDVLDAEAYQIQTTKTQAYNQPRIYTGEINL